MAEQPVDEDLENFFDFLDEPLMDPPMWATCTQGGPNLFHHMVRGRGESNYDAGPENFTWKAIDTTVDSTFGVAKNLYTTANIHSTMVLPLKDCIDLNNFNVEDRNNINPFALICEYSHDIMFKYMLTHDYNIMDKFIVNLPNYSKVYRPYRFKYIDVMVSFVSQSPKSNFIAI